jgi:hypothetical protein
MLATIDQNADRAWARIGDHQKLSMVNFAKAKPSLSSQENPTEIPCFIFESVISKKKPHRLLGSGVHVMSCLWLSL